MLDLNSLSPVPWKWTDGNEVSYHRLIDSNGNFILNYYANENGIRGSSTDEEFIVLARKAFDVMMRRGIYPVQVREGWSVWCTTPNGWPACVFGVVRSEKRFQPSTWPGPWSDPFTALIEADKWYTANVEAVYVDS